MFILSYLTVISEYTSSLANARTRRDTVSYIIIFEHTCIIHRQLHLNRANDIKKKSRTSRKLPLGHNKRPPRSLHRSPYQIIHLSHVQDVSPGPRTSAKAGKGAGRQTADRRFFFFFFLLADREVGACDSSSRERPAPPDTILSLARRHAEHLLFCLPLGPPLLTPRSTPGPSHSLLRRGQRGGCAGARYNLSCSLRL